MALKLILLALMFMGVALMFIRPAHAAPNDSYITQEEPTGGGTIVRAISPSANPWVLTFNPSTQRPMGAALGPNLTFTGGVMDSIIGTVTGPQGIQGIPGDTGPQGPTGTFTARAFSTTTLSVGSVTQVSSSRDAQVTLPVDVAVSSLLLGSAQGTVCLRYADNVGMSTNLTTVSCGTNSTGGVLNVVNVGTVTNTGIIPAGKFIRQDLTVNAGTASATARQGQVVLQ